jgi:hypothetical protein
MSLGFQQSVLHHWQKIALSNVQNRQAHSRHELLPEGRHVSATCLGQDRQLTPTGRGTHPDMLTPNRRLLMNCPYLSVIFHDIKAAEPAPGLSWRRRSGQSQECAGISNKLRQTHPFPASRPVAENYPCSAHTGDGVGSPIPGKLASILRKQRTKCAQSASNRP